MELLWNYGVRGAALSSAVSLIGTGAMALFGGWDKPLKGLLLFMGMDFVLGVLAAMKNKELDSTVAFWGGINKLVVLSLVAVGVVLDGVLPLSEPYCRTGIIFFYIAREGLSLIENYGKLGGELPNFLKEMLAQLKESHSNINKDGAK